MLQHKTERGQAIILIALAMVALLAFLALAVDGGRVYAERRRLQNAADASAMAAANAVANGADAATAANAALTQAGLNDVVDADAGVNSAAAVDVIVNNPPQHGAYTGNNEYYEVVIRTTQPASFTGLINVNSSKIEAYAVSHVEAASTVAENSSIQSLSSTNNSLVISGTTLNINGGDIYSNSSVSKNSGTTVVLDSGNAYSHGTWSNGANIKKAGAAITPTTSKAILVPGQFGAPTCPTNHFTNNVYINPTTKTLNPGYYDHEVWLGGSSTYTLKPGLYCFYNGLVVTDTATLNAKNVLFVVMNGELRLNSGKIKVTRASTIQDRTGKEFGGLLAYVTTGDSVLANGYSFAPAIPGHLTTAAANSGATCSAGASTLLDTVFGRLLGRTLERHLGCPNQTKNVTLTGGSTYTGTIYNPDHNCTVSGTTPVVVNGTLICETVTLSATTITVNNVPGQNFHLPPTIELSE
jgi:hypothetical protein